MPRDPVSDLLAVEMALADEMRREHPRPAVLASCALFLAAATRPAQERQSLIDRRIPEDDR